ncbi:hypothetical protein HGM15179_004118 [Zosterops borbonicus]|uniref:Uncharacterized protein n=1 Tax=Zosterops borbonicus TaxID=364589 RepID=A0A8K1GSB8_9PASS|nr:hypothetical protein HGM15179_004118 [Zosterops borbonicus]
MNKMRMWKKKRGRGEERRGEERRGEERRGEERRGEERRGEERRGEERRGEERRKVKKDEILSGFSNHCGCWLNLLCEYENQEDVESYVLGRAEPQEQPNINCQAQGSESHPLIIYNLHVFFAFSSSEERTDNIWQLLGNMNFVTPDKTVYLFATSQSLCSTYVSS